MCQFVTRSVATRLRAPAKTFMEIGGGHFACFTDTEEFLAALRTHVLPLAKQSF